MATIEKRGGKWRVRVRRGGVDVSESFRLKTEAQAWASKVEADAAAGKLGRAPDRPFSDLLTRYITEVVAPRGNVGSAPDDMLRINAMITKGDPLTLVRLPDLDQEHFAAWRDRRLAVVSAATVLREWNILSAICTRAVEEWRWLPAHPMRGVKLPETSKPRDRRISAEEVEKILWACGYSRDAPPMTSQARVGAIFLLALETAMRAGELCALRWSDYDPERRVLHVRAVEVGAQKTGQARVIPMSSEAVRIVEQMRGLTTDRIFGVTATILERLFRRAKARVMITGLHFHDSRAEALTRLSKKLDVMQLARVSGHKDVKLLYSVYYREKAEDLVGLLG